jgi:hypothetical protein
MKTLPVIAKELNNMPVTTLRYRISPYGDFLPFSTTSKGKEYAEQEQVTISLINDSIIEGKSQEEILQMLSQTCIRDIEIIPTTTPTTSEQPKNEQLTRLNNNLETLLLRLDRQNDLQRQVNEMRIAISEIHIVEKKWWKFW